MARRPRKVDERARAVLLDVRGRLLGTLGLAEREIDAVLARVAERLRERLTAANVGTSDLSKIIGEELAAHARHLADRTVELTQAGTRAGAEAGIGSIRIVPGEGERVWGDIGADAYAYAAAARASEEIRRRATVRELPLSTRVRDGVANIGARMRDELEASIRAGESAHLTAERMLEASPGRVQIPRYVTDLRQAAGLARATGDQSVIADAIEEAAAQLNRLGQRRRTADEGLRRRDGDYSIRSAGRELAARLTSARPQDIERIVDRWILDKAQFQARRIARTETVEAFRAGFRESVAGSPAVVGIRWELSRSHPHGDVCDVYAGQDPFGLGPGGYPKGEVPANPHPFCSCTQSAILDEQRQERELARLEGRPEPPRPWESGTREDGATWLRRQPEALQREILGPTRLALMAKGRAVLDATGAPIPVWSLRGLPRPTPAGGGVDPSSLVLADRATMVAPLPPLPESGPSGSGAPPTPPAAPPPVVPSPPPVPAAPTPPPAPPRYVSRSERILRSMGYEPRPPSDFERGKVPPAADAATALRDLGRLVDKLDANPSPELQQAIRRATRVLVQTAEPGLASGDLINDALRMDRIFVENLRGNVAGTHDGRMGEITLDRQTVADARLAAGMVRSGEPMGMRDRYGLSTLIHEAVHDHGYSAPRGLGLHYAPAMNALEETTTELLARRILTRTGAMRAGALTDEPWALSYQPVIRTLQRIVAEGLPQFKGAKWWNTPAGTEELVDPDPINDAICEAAIRHRAKPEIHMLARSEAAEFGAEIARDILDDFFVELGFERGSGATEAAIDRLSDAMGRHERGF